MMKLKQLLKETKSRGVVRSIQTNSKNIDVEKEFRQFKYAIPEHQPIKLSNGMWLHTYKLTNYDDGPHGDPDEEQDAFDREAGY